MFLLHQNKLVQLLAIFAIVIASCAPSISHYLAAKQPVQPQWNDICSILHFASPSPNLSRSAHPPETPETSHGLDCGYCALQLQKILVNSHLVSHFRSTKAYDQNTIKIVHQHRSITPWAMTLARAPPSID